MDPHDCRKVHGGGGNLFFSARCQLPNPVSVLPCPPTHPPTMPIDLPDWRGALCDPHHLGEEALSLRASNMAPLSGAATYHILAPSKEGRSDTVPGMNE